MAEVSAFINWTIPLVKVPLSEKITSWAALSLRDLFASTSYPYISFLDCLISKPSQHHAQLFLAMHLTSYICVQVSLQHSTTSLQMCQSLPLTTAESEWLIEGPAL